MQGRRGGRSSITMAQLAAAAGVSPMTVSNCYKNPDKVHEKTRAKVLSAASTLGYVPNLIASNLASGQSRMIAAVVPSLRNSSFVRTLEGLTDYLDHRGYELLLAVADNPAKEAQLIRSILGRRPSGVVLTGGEHTPEGLKMVMDANLPVVETWLSTEPSIDMAVGFSLFDAAYEMAQLMIHKGLTRIGWAGHDVPNSQRFIQRQLGFQAAMRDAGLRDDLVFLTPESLGFAGGRLALDALVRREPRLEGLCCVTDILGAGALFECIRRGWSVPERFSVGGYGDFEIAAEVPPGLTTIKTNGYEIGRVAGEMLVRKIEASVVDSLVRKVPYEMVVRYSL